MMILATLAALVIVGYSGMLFLLWRHQERIVFQPPVPIPGERCDAELVRYTSSDGSGLFGWLVEPAARRGVLLYFHGNAVLARWMVPWANEVATRLGLAVFLTEYRGYDGISGDPTYAGTVLDADAAMRACCERLDVLPSDLVLYGHSLGSAVAVEAATRTSVRSVALEAPFTSVREMSARWPLVASPLIWPWLSRVNFDSVGGVRRIENPIHVVHGERDIVIPVRMGIAVHRAARVPGQLLLVSDAGHNDIPIRAHDRYWQWLARATESAAT